MLLSMHRWSPPQSLKSFLGLTGQLGPFVRPLATNEPPDNDQNGHSIGDQRSIVHRLSGYRRPVIRQAEEHVGNQDIDNGNTINEEAEKSVAEMEPSRRDSLATSKEVDTNGEAEGGG